jgi:hypothetical protein
MSFPEPIRNEALKKAHFMCVACHAPFVDVHHILPKGEGGTDTLDNAAPLCPGCHGIYGANPVYRKQIRQMRDNWYDVCEKKYGLSNVPVAQKLNEMSETLKTVRLDQVKYQDTLDQIKKTMLRSLSSTASVINSAETFEEIATASGTANFMGNSNRCWRCGEPFLPTEPFLDYCPRCGTQRP